MFTEWEPWLSEISYKHCAQWYYWSQWNFPVPSIDYGMVMENLFIIFSTCFHHLIMLLVFLYEYCIMYWWGDRGRGFPPLVEKVTFCVLPSFLDACLCFMEIWTCNACTIYNNDRFPYCLVLFLAIAVPIYANSRDHICIQILKY